MPKTRPAGESKANVKNDPGLKEFLRIQEKLTEDYLGISRGKLKKKGVLTLWSAALMESY